MSNQPVPALWNLSADHAEKIRLARQLADAVDLDRGFRTGLTVTIRDLADSAEALLVERQQAEERGERDRQHIRDLTEALAEITESRTSFGDDTLYANHAERVAHNALNRPAAVLAGEEDTANG